ncbi:MAG: CDP-glycerol glycerophosphotransferase family protein, partial [Oscillospiraceae bacterium]|nr:CDP-glycerol glycerophosphotransferase family protein [Oscillospiraceae bacterium]
ISIRIPAAAPGASFGAALRFFTVQAFHLATARVIALNDNFMPLAELPVSRRATVLQLWHAEGALKRFGLALPLEPGLRRRVRRGAARLSAVICSSETVAPYYAQAFGVDQARVLPLGSPRLDTLLAPFDQASARAAFDVRYPSCAGKNLILYAPTFRDTPEENAQLLRHFDFAAFAQRFGKEAVLLLRLHPQLPAPYAPEDCPGAVNVSAFEDAVALLRLCGCLITDYSSLCLDAAALGLPVICYAYDYGRYARDRGFFKDLRELPPGVFVERFPDLLDAIAQPEAAGEAREAFLRFHLDRPDGRASQRILERFFRDC